MSRSDFDFKIVCFWRFDCVFVDSNLSNNDVFACFVLLDWMLN